LVKRIFVREFKLSKDKQIVLPTDTVLTVVEPIDSLKQMYEEKSKTFKMEETLND